MSIWTRQQFNYLEAVEHPDKTSNAQGVFTTRQYARLRYTETICSE